MKETLNSMIKEQFGIGKVPEKLWYVMTQDLRNLAKEPVVNGRFHPAVLLEGVHGETKADALVSFRNCFRDKSVYAVVESIEEAKKIITCGTIVMWNGKIVQE